MNHNLLIYAQNYNVLRIMSGMSGLRYSEEIYVPDAPPRPYGRWTWKNNFIFLKETRQSIWEWVLIARLKLGLPQELIHLICEWIATEPNSFFNL